MVDTHDPGVNPEEEGIPDLQNGTPQAQRASDPQQAPVPGDAPVAIDKHGTTTREQIEGEPLEAKLKEEESETTEPAPETVQEQEAGLLSDEPLPDRPANQDIYARESPDAGLSAEESAVHITSRPEAGEIEEVGETEEPEEPGAIAEARGRRERRRRTRGGRRSEA